jgi:tetratricopeptide (TPR) repeat protein
VADFKKVLDIQPENRNAPLQHLLYAIAENYRQQQDFPNALSWGEKALSEDPANDRCQQLIAEVKKIIAS